MKETREKNVKVNIFAVMIAFVFGLTIGRVDFDARVNKASEKISRTETTQMSTENLAETIQQRVVYDVVTSSEASSTSATTIKSTQADISDMVYRTPTGKRYHLDSDCAGVNRIESTVDESTMLGLTPCKKCAGG